MKVQTKYHGTIEVKNENIFQFEYGIPGFPDETKFLVLPLEDTPFVILQSVQTPDLGFVMINPFDYFPTYDFELDEQSVNFLKLSNEKDVTVFVILTVADPFHETTANLKAPIVLNHVKKIGKQVILNTPIYQTKHRLFSNKVGTK
jgi:flagellar assembly factor FliW